MEKLSNEELLTAAAKAMRFRPEKYYDLTGILYVDIPEEHIYGQAFDALFNPKTALAIAMKLGMRVVMDHDTQMMSCYADAIGGGIHHVPFGDNAGFAFCRAIVLAAAEIHYSRH